MKLVVLLTAGFLPLASTAADPSAPPSRAERLKQLRTQAEAGLHGFEQHNAGPDAKPTVRDFTAAGYVTLALGDTPAHAEAFFRQAFATQNMDAASPDFGDVPWQVGHAEIKDPNSIEFTTLSLAGALLHFSDKLSPAFLKESESHLHGALAAIRRHKVKSSYTNIFTMKTANLLMLGRILKDDSAVRDGLAALDEWLAFTRANGIGEYDSSTYNSTDFECLQHILAAAPDDTARAKAHAALDYLSADLATNYFPGTAALCGPMSRTYDFLYHRGSIQRFYYTQSISSNLEPEKPLDTFWIAAQFVGYEISHHIRDLATLPERLILSRFGPESGRDRTEYITPDFAIGSTSAYYGPQGVEISAEFASAKKLPATWVLLDPFDAPYGKARTLDRSGHSKPKVLPNLISAVQDRGAVLALFDQSPGVSSKEGKEAKSISTNVILPVEADAFYLDGERLHLPGGRKPFEFPLKPGSTICVREGNAVLAARLFAADTMDGKPAPISLKYDGNEWGAARVVAMHSSTTPTASLASLRAGVFLEMAHCADEASIGAFVRKTYDLKIKEETKGGVWSAAVDLPDAKLEAGLDLAKKHIAFRRVNGKDIPLERLSVNGRDLAAELLDHRLDSLAKGKN